MQFGSKKLIHPGSVGIPWYYDGKTQYMILHDTDKGWEEELFQLNYDVNTVKEEFKTSGIMEKAFYWSKLNLHALSTGNDYTTPVCSLHENCAKKQKEVCYGLIFPRNIGRWLTRK